MRTLVTSPTTADPRPTPGAPGAVPSRRDTLFDSLRGLLLVTMAINHIPSDLHPLTDGALGFVSSAEGFVFLSGLVPLLFVVTGIIGLIRRGASSKS